MAHGAQTDWKVTISSAGGHFGVREGQSLLTAMICAGRTGIKVGCRNGGCGVCRVRITEGEYSSEKMTRSRISEQDEQKGIVLACRVYPRSDVALEPLPLEGRAVLK